MCCFKHLASVGQLRCLQRGGRDCFPYSIEPRNYGIHGHTNVCPASPKYGKTNTQGIRHNSASYMLNVYQNHVLKYRFLSEALSLRRESLTEQLGDSDGTHILRIPVLLFLPHYGPGCRKEVLDSKRRTQPWFSLHPHVFVGSGHFINTLNSCFFKKYYLNVVYVCIYLTVIPTVTEKNNRGH